MSRYGESYSVGLRREQIVKLAHICYNVNMRKSEDLRNKAGARVTMPEGQPRRTDNIRTPASGGRAQVGSPSGRVNGPTPNNVSDTAMRSAARSAALDATKSPEAIRRKSGPTDRMQKHKIIGIIIFVVGIISLIIGSVTLVMGQIARENAASDVDYLTSIDEWQKENEPAVSWTFLGDGAGTITTDNHGNDYQMTWVLENGKISIKTEWLYSLSDEFNYEIQRDNNVLILTDANGNEVARFVGIKKEN